MIKRITVKDIRITLTIAKIAKVVGVNSELDDGNHIVMWDFDDVPLGDVKDALRRVQTRFLLSDILILRSSEPDNYLAYCFTSMDWRRAVMIVAETEHVDYQFFRFGVYRGHFTLRVGPKSKNKPYLVSRLDGYELPDCSVNELDSWVKYETLSWR
uniref:Uncharacterized protein n=1 Tax=viral metagenome TaxID=1070528 RepID=A0A6H2A3G8_9ZZZZ